MVRDCWTKRVLRAPRSCSFIQSLLCHFERPVWTSASRLAGVSRPPDNKRPLWQHREALILHWWRRGRVELPVQKNPIQSVYKLVQPLVLARPLSADRLRPSQPMYLKRPLPTSGSLHLDFSAPNSHPSRRG